MKLNENDELTGTLLDSDDMVGEVETILEDPSSLPPELQYNSKEDPEYNASEMREAFWLSYVAGSHKMEEGFSIKQAISDYLAGGGDPNNVEALAASLPETEKSAVFYKKHLDQLETQLKKYNAVNTSAPVNKETPRPAFDVNNLKDDLAKELMTSTGDEIDTVLSSKDSAEDKFSTIYTIAKTIFQGKGIKHHAFIYGDPGVGKCVSYDEKIPVRMDDAIAEAYESWLESRQK